MDIDRRGLLKATCWVLSAILGGPNGARLTAEPTYPVSELDGHQHLARRISLPLGPDRHDTVHAEFVAPRCRRSLLAAHGRLVDEYSDDDAARHRRPGDGDPATGQTRRAAASLPKAANTPRAVPAADADHGGVSVSDQAKADVFDLIECFYNSEFERRTRLA